MSSVKTLSYHGKNKIFSAIDEYINAKIDFKVFPVSREMSDDPDVAENEECKRKERCEKAKDELVEMLNKIEMRLE